MLPVHLTPFVGRGHQLDELARLVRVDRMVTLTGAGGSGKTRLAAEMAARLAGAYERTAWVDIAALHDADLIPQEVASALQLAERADVSPRELLIGSICNLRTLLVLDNCEHMVDACAELADALLRACPRVTILATSRQALGVASETAWLIPPLAGDEAVELFADRARDVLPSFALTPSVLPSVREICARLDGMPLAIELAAARVRVLSVEQIAARLSDAFRLLTGGSRTGVPRHRTLRATMEWSFGLLAEGEQVLLRRLSVFAGNFSLDAAEQVCAGALLAAEEILDGVTALVDKSLVVMDSCEGEARYHLLETVRQYALEKLRAAGELAEIEERHARYFLDVIERAHPQLFGGESEPGLLARLARDNDNFRAAAAWSVAGQGRAQIALRFTAAFFWYWYGSAHALGASQFREGKRFIAAALQRASEVECEPKLRGRALASAGLIALAQGDYREAASAFDESLALLRVHGDPDDLIMVLAKFGATRLMLGELDAAWTMLEEAYESIKDVEPDSILHSFAYSWRGWVARARGDTKTARLMHESNLRVGRSLNNRTALGHGHAFLGACELIEGDADAAFAQYCEALPYHVDLSDGWGLALDFEGLAACAALRGRHADAARLIGAVDALRERSAVALPAADVADRERRVELARQKLGAQYDVLYAEGRSLTLDEVVRVATDDSVIHTSEFRIPVPTKPRTGLRVQTLGGLRVFLGDREIDAAAWGSARPRELLVYLLMHPEGRTKEQVGLAFWPDASTAQVRNNFHVTLHRLRKTLGGTHWATLSADRYRIDQSLIDSVDVHDFERDLAAGRDEQAVERYHGHFLDGESVGDWHLEDRDRYQRMYVDALMRLGARHTSEARHDAAADAFRRVLAHDELHEEALRCLMRALGAAGDRSEALRAFQRFSSRLKSELGASPERESYALAEQLGNTTSLAR